MIAATLLLAFAPPIAHGSWYVYDEKVEQIRELVVDKTGVRGFGYRIGDGEVSLAPRDFGGRVLLSARVDDGDARVHWFPDGQTSASLWFEGALWQARKSEPPPPELVVGVRLWSFLKAENDDKETQAHIRFDRATMRLGRVGDGLEMISLSEIEGRVKARLLLRPLGRGAWLVHLDGKVIGLAAADRPSWLDEKGLRAAERCRQAQWQAKTALKAGYAAMLAFHSELGRYPKELREAGVIPAGAGYLLRLRDRKKGFLLEAEGLHAPVEGDVWTIDEAGMLANTSYVCGF